MGKTKKKKAEPLSYRETWDLFNVAKGRLEQPEPQISDLKEILDCAVDMAKFAKKENDTKTQADAVEVQLRAKRRIGQMAFGSVD
jgi:hypothetical protein